MSFSGSQFNKIIDKLEKIVENTSGGGSATVDTEMSDSSTNAVQNKVIKTYVDEHNGGGVTVIEMTMDQEAGVLTSSTTYGQVMAAFFGGSPVLLKCTTEIEVEGETYTMQICLQVLMASLVGGTVYLMYLDDDKNIADSSGAENDTLSLTL